MLDRCSFRPSACVGTPADEDDDRVSYNAIASVGQGAVTAAFLLGFADKSGLSTTSSYKACGWLLFLVEMTMGKNVAVPAVVLVLLTPCESAHQGICDSCDPDGGCGSCSGECFRT